VTRIIRYSRLRVACASGSLETVENDRWARSVPKLLR
jgi:hypothetical protein